MIALDNEGDNYCNWLTQAIKEQDVVKVESTSIVNVNLEGIVIRKLPFE